MQGRHSLQTGRKTMQRNMVSRFKRKKSDLLKDAIAQAERLDLKFKKILAIDDCPDTLNVINTFFKNQSRTVVQSFVDEELAIRSFIKEKPDLVILDMNLKHSDGIRVSIILKKLSFFRVPIIFISGDSSMANEVRKFHGNDYQFLSKPFRKESFLRAVKKAC